MKKLKIILSILTLFLNVSAFGQTLTETNTSTWFIYPEASGSPASGWTTSPTSSSGTWLSAGIDPCTWAPSVGSTAQRLLGSTFTQATIGTAYFYTKFNVASLSDILTLTLAYNVDDSATFWLNGVKILTTGLIAGGDTPKVNLSKNNLLCGSNILAVKVTNTKSGCFFVQAKLSCTKSSSGSLPSPLSFHTIAKGCATSCVTIKMRDYTYIDKVKTKITWSDGSSDTNKSICSDGLYIATSTTEGGCNDIDTFNVISEGCCSADIQTIRSNCNNFTFKLSSKYVNLNCWYWKIDGKVVKNGGDLIKSLNPGNHTICVQYIGTRKLDTNEVCCDVKCININIPIPYSEALVQEYCSMGGNLYSFNPLLFSPSISASGTTFNYTIKKVDPISLLPSLIYDSRITGPITHDLAEGHYYIDYLDSNGCIVKTLDLTIIKTMGTSTICEKTVILNCLGEHADDSIYSVQPDCPECIGSAGSTVIIGPTFDLGSDPITRISRFQRSYYHLDNCTECVFRYYVRCREDEPKGGGLIMIPNSNKSKGAENGNKSIDGYLAQNTPNPFSNNTEIKYQLPKGTQTAVLRISDLNGKQIRIYPINGEPKAGSITVQANDLQAGMYLYTLVIDGKAFDTKRMVLTAQ